MLRPERMDLVRLHCRNEDTQRVVRTLAELRVMHISQHRPETVAGRIIGNGTPIGDTAAVSEALVRARNMLDKIGAAEHGTGRSTRRDRDEALAIGVRIAAVRRISEEFAALERELEGIDRAIARIDEQEELLAIVGPLECPIETIGRTRSATVIALRTGADGIHDPGEGAHPLFTHHDAARGITLLVVKTEDASAYPAERRIDLGPLRGLRGSVEEARAALEKERGETVRRRESITAEIATFTDHGPFLRETELALARALLEARAPESFGQTRHLAIIEGFIPARRSHEVPEALREQRIVALYESAPAADAPTALENPRPIRGFEELLRLYSLPKYREIDPTSAMAITFPVFFGFMLGDIGYGIAALAISWLLWKRYRALRPLAEILMLSAGATIAFGILYGEAFGTASFLGIALTHTIHRVDDLGMLFAIAGIMGLLHLTLGVAFGMINARGAKEITGRISWAVLLVGAIALCSGAGLFEGLPIFGDLPRAPVPIALGAIILAGAGLFHAQGWRGVLEAPMALSNTISYARLAALGVASIWLAYVVNTAAADLFSLGGAWMAIGILILFLGHALNLALGTLGAFLHATRLHYVEFYTKFYEGGGTRFTPFGEMEASR